MDKYILGQSNIENITKNNSDVILNLTLEKNTYYNNCLIYGYISDLLRNPIENANIIFLNKDNKKIASVCSSKDGLYTCFGVKYNNEIKIVVNKLGYKTNISYLMHICQKKFKYDVSLKKQPISNKTIISGHLLDENKTPLKGIIVYLLKNCCEEDKYIYKTTITNEYGQFVFQDIPKGKYLILINNKKFDTYNKYIEIIKTDKIFSTDIILTKKSTVTKISGKITNNIGKAIPHAIVILYKVRKDKKLIPVKHTICDKKGKYSFTNIPYDNYIVKAK